jgi:hypothetical protein
MSRFPLKIVTATKTRSCQSDQNSILVAKQSESSKYTVLISVEIA